MVNFLYFLFFSYFNKKNKLIQNASKNINCIKNNIFSIKINNSTPYETNVNLSNVSYKSMKKMYTMYYKYDVYKFLLDPSNNINIKLEKVKEYESLFLENSLKKQLNYLYNEFKKDSIE